MTRALDNLVLTAVRLRRWMGVPAVAREVGATPDWVLAVTEDVRADDMATPDPGATVQDMRAAYAWHGGRKP